MFWVTLKMTFFEVFNNLFFRSLVINDKIGCQKTKKVKTSELIIGNFPWQFIHGFFNVPRGILQFTLFQQIGNGIFEFHKKVLIFIFKMYKNFKMLNDENRNQVAEICFRLHILSSRPKN